MAIVVALIGTAVILRPGFRDVEPGHMAMLVAAVVFAGSYLLAKILADEVKPAVVVGMLSVFVTIGLAPFAFADWVTPTWADLGLYFGIACFATAGHFTMTLAFAAAFLGTGPIYKVSVGPVRDFAVSQYGAALADITTLIWGVIVALTVFAFARASLATAITLGGLALAARLF